MPTKVAPDDCKAMVSFNDATAGLDAQTLANFLTDNGIPTFCTRIYCPGMAGNWRDVTKTGANTCDFYIPLMTDGWQKSDECQFETKIVENRVADKEVTVIPVWFDSFDKTYDKKEKQFYWNTWKSFQACFRKDETWMDKVLACVGGTKTVAAAALRSGILHRRRSARRVSFEDHRPTTGARSQPGAPEPTRRAPPNRAHLDDTG